MKKILIVDRCVDLMGGVERTLCALANALVEQNEVTVLSEKQLKDKPFFDWDKRIKKDYLFYEVSRQPRVRLKLINKVLSFSERIIEGGRKKRLIREKIKLYSDVDVIVFGRVFVALDYLPFLRENKKMPKIIVRDAIHLGLFKAWERKKLLRLFPGSVDTFIVSSDESSVAYEKFFGEKNINLVKIYNPLGIVPKHGYSFESKNVISIGRMDDDQKGFSCLIKAFSIVHRKHNDWRLTIYGDGAMSSRYRKMIKRARADDYISILPSTRDVVYTLNKSAIFVLASRFEGYANILVEALACGIPSITFNWLMGSNEIINDGINGAIVGLGDRKAYMRGANNIVDQKKLADEICRLIENPDIAERYSRNGVKIIKSRDPDDIIKKWISLINVDKA